VEIRDKVVAVTGGASGIGFGMARAFADAGARVVLLDIEADALSASTDELARTGAEVHSYVLDVRDQTRFEYVARSIASTLGGADVLCNNAGVLAPPAWVWEAERSDVEWVFAVNFWGALNGVQAFVPLMIERGTPAHVVNTSSITALAHQAGAASYMMSKAAVVALSEDLREDLRAVGAPIGVSVVLPEHFRSRLGSAHRNRASRDDPDAVYAPAFDEDSDPMATGADPVMLGRRVVDSVERDRFWILPDRSDAMSQMALDRNAAIAAAFG
jgi:NAD(P)-dependent dehydrogenase (short-subunit alcohol dehydrogenase family)